MMNITTEMNINGELEEKRISITNLDESIHQAEIFIGFSKERDEVRKGIYWTHILNKLLRL